LNYYFLMIYIHNPHIFFKWIPINTQINDFIIHVHLEFPNINIQFILYLYTSTTYYTSYMTKLNKLKILKLHYIIQKCIETKIDANTQIQTLGSIFLMLNKWLLNLLTLCFFYHCIVHLEPFNSSIYIFLKLFFCVKTISCIKSIKTNSINIICSFTINKYINHLNHYESLSLSKFIFMTYK